MKTKTKFCLFFPVLMLFVIHAILLGQDTDRYNAWKQSLAPERESKTIISVHNDYVAVQLDDEDGQFNIGTYPDNITLTYAFPSSPWSSWVVIRVDGTNYTMDPDDHGGSCADMPVTDPFSTVYHSGDSSYIEGGWTISDVDITQTLMPVYIYNETDTTGTIFIHYRIVNNDDVNHNVGVLLQLDTMIDFNDAAPLSTAYGYSAIEQDWYAPDIPPYWTACTDPPPPDPSVICAQGYLTGYDAVSPDRFAVGSWGSFYDVDWGYSVSHLPYGDSSVLLWWYEVLIPPGDSWEVATYYGLGLPETYRPEVTIMEPDSFTYSACADQQIILRIYDDSGIQEETIELNVNGVTYTHWSDEIDWASPYLTFTPSILFEHGDTVTVTLMRAEDFFGNDIDAPVSWQFYIDLEGPYIFDFFPIQDTVTYDTLSMVTFRITDDITGVDSLSILATLTGILTPSYSGMFDITGTGIHWAGDQVTVNPVEAGFSFTLDDTVTLRVIRAVDMPDYCSGNDIGHPNSWSFVMGDDDTLPPSFSNYFVDEWPEENPFNIECSVADPSGVFDDLTDIAGQGIYLIWDNDGDVSITDYQGIVQIDSVGPGRYRTVTPIAVQPGGSDFVYIIRAYDNDFEYSNPGDRTEGFSPMQSVVKVELEIPYTGAYTSCPDQVIRINLESVTGVLADSLVLTAQDRIFTVPSSADLTYSTPNLTLDPSFSFTEGFVQVELSNIYDLSFIAAPSSQSWSFYVDLTPPVISLQTPEPGSEVLTDDFTISFSIADSMSGLNHASIEVLVDDIAFDVNSTGVTWNGEVFEIDVLDAGLTFADGVTVTVIVTAEDLVDVDFCPSNVLETSWEFAIGANFCSRSPNPITPNGDNKNDKVTFTFPNMAFRASKTVIRVFSTEGNMVRELTEKDLEGDKWQWDGKDNEGKPCKQGVYIYIIKEGDKIICNGSVTVVR
ncbi:gliding motility-associated C-terminal domain-containing protein [bacterium]|nr:gliding motility-associated C-terminal domain-containing protein [bacterium]